MELAGISWRTSREKDMSKKILMIVENRQLRNRFSEFLNEMGYFVKATHEVASAITMSHMLQPDLILCDSSLPGFTGNKIVELFKKERAFSQVPFVLITHKIPSQRMCDFINSGCPVDDYLCPPLEWISLYNIVSKWLENSKKVKKRSAQPTHEFRLKSPPKKRPSNRRQKGKVNVLSISRLFWNLAENESSGVLNIKKENHINVHISSGKLVDIQSNYIPSDSLGRYLIQEKLITTRENKVSINEAKKQETLQGQILLRFNLIDNRDLLAHLTQHKSMKVFRLFQYHWKDSKYEFTPGKVKPELDGMRPLSLHKALKFGILNIANFNNLYDVFEKRKKFHLPIQLTNKYETISKQLSLEPNIREVILRYNMKSLYQIKKASNDDFKTLLRYFFLFIITQAAKFSSVDERKDTSSPHVSEETINEMLSTTVPSTMMNYS